MIEHTMTSIGKVRITLIGGGIALAGTILSILVALSVANFVDIDSPSVTVFIMLFIASYAGYALAGIGYLKISGRGSDYIDIRLPDMYDFLYFIGGTIGLFVLLAVVGYLVALLDLPTTSHNLFEPGLNPRLLLVLIPLVLFVNAPVEEFLFRNIIQKLLYENFTRWEAELISSAVFAVVHLPAYYNPNLWAALTSLVVVFLGSLVFGIIYAQTDNLLVPIVVHGLFNTIQIIFFYLALTSERTIGLLLWFSS